MCLRCLQSAYRWWPHISWEETNRLLWGATCYPFGDFEQVEEQLIEMAERAEGSVPMALCIADEELGIVMEKMNRMAGAEEVE